MFLFLYKLNIWYNAFMDEKKDITKVLEKIEAELRQEFQPKVSHQKQSDFNQSNPIYKKFAKFVNAKIGDKFSIRDLLR